MFESDLRLLGLEGDASNEDIKRAFRKKSLIYHPDRNGGNAEMFQRLVEAKERLLGNGADSGRVGSVQKRKRYVHKSIFSIKLED
jgi:chaperone protein DnaJ